MTTTPTTTPTTYRVERSIAPDGAWEVLISGLDAAATAHRDATARPNTSYRYRVGAHDGTTVMYSNIISVTTPPGAPVLVRVTPLSHREVEIVWTNEA